jgi:DNA-binding LytR/AlgR family response regulator
LRGRIASLHAEDHYVRIYAEDGDCLVLMRFQDAVNMMPVEAGFKVHRSHWVSLASLVEIQRIDNRNFGVMADGRLVPISRNHVAHVHRHLANQKLNRS